MSSSSGAVSSLVDVTVSWEFSLARVWSEVTAAHGVETYTTFSLAVLRIVRARSEHEGKYVTRQDAVPKVVAKIPFDSDRSAREEDRTIEGEKIKCRGGRGRGGRVAESNNGQLGKQSEEGYFLGSSVRVRNYYE